MYGHNIERLISYKVAGCIFDTELTSFIEALPKRTITRFISKHWVVRSKDKREGFSAYDSSLAQVFGV